MYVSAKGLSKQGFAVLITVAHRAERGWNTVLTYVLRHDSVPGTSVKKEDNSSSIAFDAIARMPEEARHGPHQ
jgi:hypothetical protein